MHTVGTFIEPPSLIIQLFYTRIVRDFAQCGNLSATTGFADPDAHRIEVGQGKTLGFRLR